MKWVLTGTLTLLLLTAPQASANQFEKLLFVDPGPLRIDTARHVAYAWARRDVRNGWAHSYSRPDCVRLSRIRIRCEVRQYGLEDSYDPAKCKGESIDPRADCEKVTDSWPFTLYIARNPRCVSLWVWGFERFACWR